MPNLLIEQARQNTAPEALHIFRGWEQLLDQWAALNGLKRTPSELTLDSLIRGLKSGGRWGSYYNWPDARWLCDHPSSFRDATARAAAITSELYGQSDFEALLRYAPSIGLVAHTPPNPRASFWFPGFTRLVVLTRPDFGEVKWLPDQLTFKLVGRDAA